MAGYPLRNAGDLNMQPPNEPTGNSPWAAWGRKLLRYARSLEFQNVDGVYKITRGTTGSRMISVSGKSSQTNLFKITALHVKDFFSARQWDAKTETFTGSEVNVAKCTSARMIGTETIDGESITYAYPTTDNYRLATSGSSTEHQVCHTRYRVGDLVGVARVANGTGISDANAPGDPASNLSGNVIFLIEQAPERFWCYQHGQTGPI